MLQKPRPFTSTFFNWKELTTSVVQGLMITAGNLVAYQYAIHQGYDEATTRSMVFTVLITSNIILTLVNRSFYYSILTTLKYKNNLVLLIISITILITSLLMYVKPLANFFELDSLNLSQLGISVLIGLVFVIWFEIVKWRNRRFK
jgi:Ca2+-transporting ATPase